MKVSGCAGVGVAFEGAEALKLERFDVPFGELFIVLRGVLMFEVVVLEILDSWA